MIVSSGAQNAESIISESPAREGTPKRHAQSSTSHLIKSTPVRNREMRSYCHSFRLSDLFGMFIKQL